MNDVGSLNKLYIGNELYEYRLKLSKRKSFEIKISTDGQIFVSAPFYMSYKEIDILLKQKSEWIYNKLHILKEKNKGKQYDIFTMTNVLFMGRNISLDVKETDIKRVRLNFDGNKIELFIPSGFEIRDREILVRENLKKFYKKYTLEYLNNRLHYYEEKMGVKSASYKVKDQKTRWGSCSTRANLNFNFRLSMTPEFVFDYIIVHELSHLTEMNHSQKFWKLVEKYYPDYKNAKLWLKDNTNRLMFI